MYRKRSLESGAWQMLSTMHSFQTGAEDMIILNLSTLNLQEIL